MARYNVNLPEQLDRDLRETAVALGATKAEVLRRALMLFKHAVGAERIELTQKDGERQTVLVK